MLWCEIYHDLLQLNMPGFSLFYEFSVCHSWKYLWQVHIKSVYSWKTFNVGYFLSFNRNRYLEFWNCINLILSTTNKHLSLYNLYNIRCIKSWFVLKWKRKLCIHFIWNCPYYAERVGRLSSFSCYCIYSKSRLTFEILPLEYLGQSSLKSSQLFSYSNL